jgi:hypothetical protein
MRGTIPPLPQYVFMAWCLVKHRDNFTFTNASMEFLFDTRIKGQNINQKIYFCILFHFWLAVRFAETFLCRLVNVPKELNCDWVI